MQEDWASVRKFKAEHTAEEVDFVDQVFEIAERNYERGGDTIVECYSVEEAFREFKTLDQVREMCGLQVEAELNAREGTDEDAELKRFAAFQEWES